MVSHYKEQIARETAICHKSYDSLNWDFLYTYGKVYKQICQSFVFRKKIACPCIFLKSNMFKCWSIKDFFLGLLLNCEALLFHEQYEEYDSFS